MSTAATTATAKEGSEGLNSTTGLPPAEESQKKVNAWTAPGPAAFDFRSELPFLASEDQLLTSNRRCGDYPNSIYVDCHHEYHSPG